MGLRLVKPDMLQRGMVKWKGLTKNRTFPLKTNMTSVQAMM